MEQVRHGAIVGAWRGTADSFPAAGGLYSRGELDSARWAPAGKGDPAMASKQSEAVRRHWAAARAAMAAPGDDGPDDESWGNLTAEPRQVDYLEAEAGGVPAMWAVPKGASTDR